MVRLRAATVAALVACSATTAEAQRPARGEVEAVSPAEVQAAYAQLRSTVERRGVSQLHRPGAALNRCITSDRVTTAVNGTDPWHTAYLFADCINDHAPNDYRSFTRVACDAFLADLVIAAGLFGSTVGQAQVWAAVNRFITTNNFVATGLEVTGR